MDSQFEVTWEGANFAISERVRETRNACHPVLSHNFLMLSNLRCTLPLSKTSFLLQIRSRLLSRLEYTIVTPNMSSRRSLRVSGRSLVNGSSKPSEDEKALKSSDENSKGEKALPKTKKPTKRKVSQEVEPSTPKRRNKAKAVANPPPLTPTPSAVPVIAEGTTATPKKNKKTRRADPRATNAPLQTPGGSRVVKAYDVDPSVNLTGGQTANSDIITTDNLLEKACAHLCAVDPRLKSLTQKHICKTFSPEGLAEEVDPFVALSSSIISQQVYKSSIIHN
jgi:DNA-3-methyladenine glycosylase II